MTFLNLQRALVAAGFDPGPLDGQVGPRTRAAIRAFQAARGLTVDGIAGPLTLASLRPLPTDAAAPDIIPSALVWLVRAWRLIGLAEEPGSADNPEILRWARAVDLPYDHDDIPWCGLFMAHCIASTLPQEPLPDRPLGARQWLGFGVAVPPQLGAIMVFWRGAPTGWSGHVALYWAEDATSYHVLGGNQSDAVTLTKIAKSRFLGARWPGCVPPLGITRHSDARRILSTNEA